MGFFDKLKGMKNAVTGGAAKVNLSLDADDLELGTAFNVHVTVEAKATVQASAVYIMVRSTEYTQASDGDRISEDVVGQIVAYNHRIDIAGPQQMEAGQNYEFDAEIELDEDDCNPTFDGEIMQHRWEIQAAVDATGNDPDSGWLGFEIF